MKPTDKKKMKELKAGAHNLQPTVRIGKSGITEALIDELAGQLKNKKLIKAKALGCDRNEVRRIAEELAQRTSSELVEVRGNTMVFWKP